MIATACEVLAASAKLADGSATAGGAQNLASCGRPRYHASMRSLDETLRIGERLDRRFAELRGEMTHSKERSLAAIARILAATRTRYAVIGGIAVQAWSEEPRTTLDIAVAVASWDAFPRAAFEAEGFSRAGRHAHSENWVGPDGTPVQFAADPAFAAAVDGAVERAFSGGTLRIAPVVELVRMKLVAARDPARRRSKRLLDLSDAVRLCEQYPETGALLSPAERAQLSSD
ncbi:MAG: hypothetical protein HMLKMBBP_03442 [Planctomycetes bacterium]|nr:hypothetical protein [Planctomycetota bacterium]